MADHPTDIPIDRHEADRRTRRRLIGILLLIIAVFPLLSMMMYDWRDISLLQSPPKTPPANLFGLAGAWSVFMGYSFLGLALWAALLFMLGFSAILLHGGIQRTRHILYWSPLSLMALCCLMQLGSDGIFAFALNRLNLTDAGGAVGYFLMTRLLTRWFNPAGGALLMVGIMLFALIMSVGIRNIASGLGHFTGWWSLRQARRQKASEEAQENDREAAAERLKERARQASEEAKRLREEERLKKREAEAQQPPPRPQPEPRKEPPAPTRKPAPAKGALPDYPLPPIALLNPPSQSSADHGNVREIEELLVKTLKIHDFPAEVVGTIPGPVVTQYELRPEPHIRVERIKGLQRTIQTALEAKTIRIEAPIPGKNAIGIEIPNRRARSVTFREIVEGLAWKENTCEIPLVLGKDVAGNDIVYDLAKAPHLLVAGATGSGKSVCLNSIMTGFLMSRSPEQLRLILIDPKRVEFTLFNDLPHLLVPVINDSKRVAFGLRWALIEMDKRYKLLQKANCRNIVAFNARQTVTQTDLFGAGAGAADDFSEKVPDRLPYIVIVVDEVADIMSAVGKEVEPAIARLTALSRAVGIHLILATQRPSVDVITGTIKANIPGRIAFKVSQANDSRTILDSPGAEDLIGKGDMLFLREGSLLQRAQGAWVSDNEIARVVEFVKQNCPPCYDQTLVGKLDRIKEADPSEGFDDENAPPPAPSGGAGMGAQGGGDSDDESDEATADKALEIIRMTRRASVSTLQRRMNLGYNRAGRIMDILEARGVVSPQGSAGKGAREILVDIDNLPASAFSTLAAAGAATTFNGPAPLDPLDDMDDDVDVDGTAPEDPDED